LLLPTAISGQVSSTLDGNGKIIFINWGVIMPYVNIKITKEGATPEQKAELIKGVTDLLTNILGKNPETTVVTIDEVETDNWGIGGESVTVRRKRGQ
jgi:4-oxalocrotonate tautomerase